MFFRTFSAVLSSLCFAPLMRAFRTFRLQYCGERSLFMAGVVVGGGSGGVN